MSVSVYVTISNDSDFVQGNDGTVMAHVPFTVEYFNLADYGLEKYHRLDENDEVIEQPTVLHLLIRVLERYYAMRVLDKGDMNSNIVSINGERNSLWLNRFWGHDGNLMYFVNHMYPIMYGTNGATADYILLSDGDDVDLAMYTDWGFYNNSAFLYFDQGTANIKTGRPLELQLFAKPTAVVNDGVDRESIPMQNETIRISSDNGWTWTQAEEKTDADGMISLTFDSPGTYYVASGPSHTNYIDAAPAICVVDVRDVTPEEQALANAKQKAIADLQGYKSPDLYREAEQVSLASILEDGIASINAADSVTGVQTAYNDAVSRIDALKTKAQYEAEEQGQGGEQDDPIAKELAEAKTNAKTELEAYKETKNPDLYRDEQKLELVRAVEQGNIAIDAAETEDAVKALLAEYKGKIDQLKTIAQYEAEEVARKAREAEKTRKARIQAAAIKKAKAAKTTVKVKALKKHKAKITWKKVTLSYTVDGKKYSRKITGYKVYRATKKNGKYKLVKTVKKASTLKYTDKKLKKGKKYYYKVRTYTRIDGKTYLGKWSKAKKIRTR